MSSLLQRFQFHIYFSIPVIILNYFIFEQGLQYPVNFINHINFITLPHGALAY